MIKVKEKKWAQKFFLVILFSLSIGLFARLQADTSALTSFSLELKEWLVLEVRSTSGGFSNTGNFQALGQMEIIPGQPVQLRALLSVGEGKTISLRGVVYFDGGESENQSILIWRGQGDLQGEGLVHPGQESTFAVWQGNGLKTGSLVFLEAGNNSGAIYKAVFTLSAI